VACDGEAKQASFGIVFSPTGYPGSNVLSFRNLAILFVSYRTTFRPFDLSDWCASLPAKASVAREDQVLRAEQIEKKQKSSLAITHDSYNC